jgi:hypothetical protein
MDPTSIYFDDDFNKRVFLNEKQFSLVVFEEDRVLRLIDLFQISITNKEI